MRVDPLCRPSGDASQSESIVGNTQPSSQPSVKPLVRRLFKRRRTIDRSADSDSFGHSSSNVGVAIEKPEPESSNSYIVKDNVPVAVTAQTKSKRRLSKSFVVAIKGKSDDFSYAAALKSARQNISLQDIGIINSKIRRAANGGMLIELPGLDNGSKADQLMCRLKDILPDAVVSRPIKQAEIRLSGLDLSITQEEIMKVFTDTADCTSEHVNMSSVYILRNGLGVVWVRLPLAVAIRAANEGALRIGWSTVRVELLEAKPVQCFRCWQFGHVRFACKSTIDRSGRCFRCGGTGHTLRTCTAPLCCVICRDAGALHSHRMGSATCTMRSKSQPSNPNRRSDHELRR